MPRRSNPFQQLVTLLHQQLAKTATVTESEMLIDQATDEAVEVDVVVRSEINQIPVVLGIECTATSRPATVEWVREIVGKHQPLAVDKTVLVSRSGFTGQALKRAAAEGIVALSLDEAKDADWLAFLEKIGELTVMSWRFVLQTGTVTFERDVLDEASAESTIRPVGTERSVTLREYAVEMLHRPAAGHAYMRARADHLAAGGKESSSLKIGLVPGEPTELLATSGQWRRIEGLELQVAVDVRDKPLRMAGASLGPHQIAHGIVEDVFTSTGEPADYAVVNFLAEDGTLTRGSILFPGFDGGQPEVHHLDIVHENESQ